MEKWEVNATKARRITNEAPMRKLRTTKETICKDISCAAYLGKSSYVIDFCYYEVSCLEDWTNIYNWLLKLGYTVGDGSGYKPNPHFTVKW